MNENDPRNTGFEPQRGMPPTLGAYRKIGGKLVDKSELASYEDEDNDEGYDIDAAFSNATVFDEEAGKFALNPRIREELIEAGVDPDSIDMDRDHALIVEELSSILDPHETLDLYDQYEGDPPDGDWGEE